MYYDGTKLLSLKDINNEKPEIFICTSNRSAGKTTYFNRLAVNRFLKNNEKFMLVYRFNYELDDCVDKFFKEIQSLFFQGKEMTSRKRAKGIYCELYLDGKHCGYAISLNSADILKKYSHMFADVERMLFDEFQSETNHYCSDEVKKLISIHTSVARGGGKQCRYVPLIMISNPVSILNPYYTEMGIIERLRPDTKFLRGEGFVMEQGYNDSASQAQKESGFNRAFSGNKYVEYSTESSYLNDINTFIEKPEGKNKYYCTLTYMGVDYAVREYEQLGYIYVDKRVDSTNKLKLCVTTEDMNINYIMIQQNHYIIDYFKELFKHGCVRFKDLQCKNAFINTIKF